MAYFEECGNIYEMTHLQFARVSPVIDFREHVFRNYFSLNEIRWIDGYYWFDIQFIGNFGSEYHFIGRFADDSKIDVLGEEPFEIINHGSLGNYIFSDVIDAIESGSFSGLYSLDAPIEELRDLL